MSEESIHTAKPSMMLCYHFDVYGTPAPQGSKKFVGLTKKGRGVMVESSQKVKPWREAVKDAALATRGVRTSQYQRYRGNNTIPPAVPAAPIDGPIVCRMVFTVAKPASAPKRRRTWPMSKPDLSKLVRSTEDALSDAGLWKDDARVVEYQRLAKVYPGEDAEALDTPGCTIEVWSLVPGGAS